MLKQLIPIVKEVGDLLLDWRRAGIREGVWHGSQFKAKVDVMAHNALQKLLQDLWPQIPVISEENPLSLVTERPDLYWLIDPIDGTASFVNGFNGFVTQAALMLNACPVLSVIYAPVTHELYWAERGRGAYLNENRISVSEDRTTAILIDNYPEPRGVTLEAYKALHCQKYLECGSISLKICKIADRTADIFFKPVHMSDWDLAAPQLVIEEAGGILRDILGEHIRYQGDYSQPGIIAAADEVTSARALSWYTTFMREGCAS